MQKEEEKPQEKKPFPIRLVLFLVVGILLISGIWYGYYWYSSTNAALNEAKRRIGEADAYVQLTQKIEEEHRRCQQFIAQEEGEFGEFQYCQRFIEWVENVNTPSEESL